MPDDANKEQFIGEAMTPAPGTADAAAMSRGEPGLPASFEWREMQYRIVGVISTWKTSGQCRQSTETYLRRHWFKILTDPPMIMTIYCDRQAKDRSKPKARWWVYTVESVATDDDLEQ